MPDSFEVVERFEITGRGVAAVISEVTSLAHGKEVLVTIRPPNAPPFEATAFQEHLLRRSQAPLEQSVLLLAGLVKSQVPIGSRIEVG